MATENTMQTKAPAPHTTHPQPIGVLLCNLGTPDAPTPQALRRYLKEFLSDRRVVEIPRFIWWFILRLFILPFRPKKSAKAYAKIWDKATGDSPLRAISFQQQEALQNALDTAMPDTFKVRVGMRYGNPSLQKALDALKKAGCTKILFFPLYPHYASATTGSACDAFFSLLKKERWMPTTRIVAPYFDHPQYIKALAAQTQDFLNTLEFTPEKFVLSYHGIPQKTHEKGDPYPCHCKKTSRLLHAEMGWKEEDAITTFQSRFGPAEWVKPYTDKTLEDLAKAGIKKLAVLTPAFHTDCLETLEEIAIEGKKVFLEEGGSNYETAPCLNASQASINLLKDLVLENTQGWLTKI